MHVRGCCDHEVESSSARLPAAADEGCREPPPFACDCSIDRKRVEGRLNDAEPLGPACSLVFRAGDEDAEVQLGERGGADRAFELTRTLRADEDRGIEEDAHLLGEDIGDLAGNLPQIGIERPGNGCLPDSL